MSLNYPKKPKSEKQCQFDKCPQKQFNNQYTWSNFLALLAKWLDYSSHSGMDTLLGSALISTEWCKKVKNVRK